MDRIAVLNLLQTIAIALCVGKILYIDVHLRALEKVMTEGVIPLISILCVQGASGEETKAKMAAAMAKAKEKAKEKANDK